MTCVSFKTYGTGTPTLYDTLNNPDENLYIFTVHSELWLDRMPCALVANGMTRDQAKTYMSDNMAAILSTNTVVKLGEVIPQFSAVGNINPGAASQESDWYAGYLEGVPPFIGGNPTLFGGTVNNIGATTVDTGGVVANCFAYSLTFEFSDCPDQTATVEGTWDYLYFNALLSGDPGYLTWSPTLNIVTAIADFDGWFNCAMGLCGGPAPTPGPGFLIPLPNPLGPGEQNISNPVQKSPLYLANHTFQFNKNFGRVK